ncbi:MAG: hypothetical protein LBB58_06485 [Cellulomonadaceae bacterium]|jgi:hypothetical protein|nr:hypothetical protein [Cellulomonadaceae bacterium]
MDMLLLTKDSTGWEQVIADHIAAGDLVEVRIGQALEHQLDDIEDAYLADESYREYVAGGRKSRPLTQLCAELGIDPEMSNAEREQLLADIR